MARAHHTTGEESRQRRPIRRQRPIRDGKRPKSYGFQLIPWGYRKRPRRKHLEREGLFRRPEYGFRP
jgi:hypothetical protein